MTEGQFKTKLIKEIEEEYPGCIILKNDPNYIQGIPDILILFKNKWIALETKIEKDANKQLNQQYYIDLMNSMSFASFVYPENKEEVLNDIQQTFRTRW